MPIRVLVNDYIGLRELRRAADDRGEHGVEVERGIDRAQHFFERLQFADRAGQLVGAGLQFPKQPRVLQRDHPWSAKVRTSSICRSLNGSTRFRARLIVPSTSPWRSSGTPSMVRRPDATVSGCA